MTKDGQPYGPIRYREIVQECYIISRHLNTSYTDLMNITPNERRCLLEMIKKESDEMKEMMEKQKEKYSQNKKQ